MLNTLDLNNLNLLESRILQFKDAAVDAAGESSFKYHKHGALLIRNGKIISHGFNDQKHHAEENAILAGYRVLWGLQERKDI